MGESLHAWLAGLAAPREGQRIADLGCGRGSVLRELAGRSGGATLVGLDLRSEALRGAQRALGGARGGGGLVLADLAEQLPLSSSSFDTVLCHDVLECIPDADGFLEEVARVLRPGGPGRRGRPRTFGDARVLEKTRERAHWDGLAYCSALMTSMPTKGSLPSTQAS